MRLRYSFADFLKRTDQTIGEKTWADFIHKGFETPILREKDLLLDASPDSWWEELLSINSEITVPTLRRCLEETLDSQWFDQARSYAVDGFKWTREELLSIQRDLAYLWMDGPHDLIGSTFRLPSVIPDPFSRHRNDRGRQFEVTELHPALKAVQFQTDPPLPPYKLKTLPSEEERDSKAGRRVERYALGRRFFVTDRGFMRLGPPTAQVDDCGVVLFGCEVPFVPVWQAE
jgi:hypothetical protein